MFQAHLIVVDLLMSEAIYVLNISPSVSKDIACNYKKVTSGTSLVCEWLHVELSHEHPLVHFSH